MIIKHFLCTLPSVFLTNILCAQLTTESVDFIVLDPSVLTYISGQSVGDTQCVNITILDDSVPQGERNISIRVDSSGNGTGGEDGGYGNVHVNPSLSSIEFIIELDVDDCKLPHIQLLITYLPATMQSSLLACPIWYMRSLKVPML